LLNNEFRRSKRFYKIDPGHFCKNYR
jgi:hypothetical protein